MHLEGTGATGQTFMVKRGNKNVSEATVASKSIWGRLPQVSGGELVVGSFLIKSMVQDQTGAPARSSGEAELTPAPHKGILQERCGTLRSKQCVHSPCSDLEVQD